LNHSPSSGSEGTHALVASRRRAVARLRFIVTLLVALPTLGYLGAAAYLYEHAFADAAVSLDRTVRIAREHALKLFDTNQMLLQRMLDLVSDRSDEQLLDDGNELHRRLAEMAAPLPQVQGLFVNGADARMIASSRVYPPRRDIDYKDRDWYRPHAQGGQGNLRHAAVRQPGDGRTRLRHEPTARRSRPLRRHGQRQPAARVPD
jgi:hypothetical protein